MANERLRVLEDVEKEIAMVLQCAGEGILLYRNCIIYILGDFWYCCISVIYDLLSARVEPKMSAFYLVDDCSVFSSFYHCPESIAIRL